MNRGAKRAAKALFDYAGGTSWIRRRFRNAVRILMYHRFPQGSRFEAQCAHLRKFYRPVTLTDAAERLRGEEPVAEPMVVVTVDDGYRDFLENAFPILTQYGIPATVFLTTDLPDRESWLWVDQVTYCLRQTRVAEITLFNSGRRWTLDTDERRKEAGLSIKQALKTVPNQERLEWLAKLPGLLKVELPTNAAGLARAAALGRCADAGPARRRIRGTHQNPPDSFPPGNGGGIECGGRRIAAAD